MSARNARRLERTRKDTRTKARAITSHVRGPFGDRVTRKTIIDVGTVDTGAGPPARSAKSLGVRLEQKAPMNNHQ